jgi:putative two-component system response regulator
VYDALTSKRVYKDAFSHDIARDIICKDSGTHFSPEVVAAFMAKEAEFIKIAERYREPASAVAA